MGSSIKIILNDMKTKNCKTIYRLLLLFSLSFFISCNEKEENVASVINDNITTGNPLELTVSSENVTLNQDNWDKEAVSFTWKPGRSRGENRGLTYLFKMDVAGKNFTTSIPTEEIWEEEIHNGIYTKTYTNKQLNDLISQQWKDYLGGEIKLSVRVIAKVISNDKLCKTRLFYPRFFRKKLCPFIRPAVFDRGCHSCSMGTVIGNINDRSRKW